MLRRVIDTINRIAESKPSAPESKPTHTREQLIQWATGCMWEALPDSFYSAWVEYSRSASNEVSLSYKCILVKGAEVTTFQPADDLYPAQCIEQLSSYLEAPKRNWKSCKIEFNPQTAAITYEY